MKQSPKIRKTYQQKILLDQKTEKDIFQLSRVMIYLWNLACAQAEIWLETKEKPVTAYSFNYWLTTLRASVAISHEIPISFSEVSSDLSREVLRKLAGSYQSFFALKKNQDGRARKPGPKNPDTQFQTLSWTQIKIVETTMILPKGSGERLEIQIPEYLWYKVSGKKVVHATISRKDGEFFLSLVVVETALQMIEKPTFFRAIDLGSGNIAVTDSSGSEFLISARRPDKYWQAEIKMVEERQKKCTKNSRAWIRRANARRKMHKKGGNQRTDYQRKLAHALLEKKVECIIISKPKTRLGLAQSTGTADQHVGVQNTGYMFRLLTFIKEKAVEWGVPVIEIADPRRQGSLDDPQTKFFASRNLLVQGMSRYGVQPTTTAYTQKKFAFNSSSGVDHTRTVPSE